MERTFGSIFWLCLTILSHSSSSTFKLLGDEYTAETVLGGKAELPCDVTTYNKSDSLHLVVWYRDEKPFYSYDNRLQKHWRSKDFADNTRVLFTLHREPAVLLMDRVTAEDEGIFKCRADFSLSPTRNLAVYLNVIIPPGKPFFMDEIGTKVEGHVGPFHEGDTLLLNCLAVGGQPIPKLTWWKGSTLLDSSDEPSEVPNVTENQLFIVLTRDYLGATIQCTASNNNMTPPTMSSLQIEVYVSPETVSILSSNQALSAGKMYELSCFVNGSHPLPEVSWWLDGKIITDQEIVTQEVNGEIITVLHFQPKIEYNGLDLTCLATNAIMSPSHGSKSHTIRLNIYYPPTISLSLVTNKYGNDTVREGQVIQMRCMIEANPWITNTEWFANNMKIQGKSFHKSDISMTTSDLIIMNASLDHIGDYMCRAHNIEGSGESNSLFINVLYKPKCVHKKTYINHYIFSLTCPVYAKPNVIKYYWKIENQKSNYLNENIYITDRNSMVLDHVEKSLETNYVDEVEISCWAVNEIGEQKSPCLIVLRHSFIAPSKPEDCEMESEVDSITLYCPPGTNTSDFMYGVSAWKILNDSKVLVKNITTPMSLIKIGSLQEGRLYEMSIYAMNKWGQSEPIYLYANTSITPSVFEAVVTTDVGLWSGMAIGVLVVLVFIIVAIIFKMKSKSVINSGMDAGKTNVANGRVKSNHVNSTATDATEKPLLYRNGKINTNNVILTRNNSDPKMIEDNIHMTTIVHNNSVTLPPVNRNNKPKLPKNNIKSEGTNTTPIIKRSYKANKHRKEIKKSNGAIQMHDKNDSGINAGLQSLALSKESIV